MAKMASMRNRTSGSSSMTTRIFADPSAPAPSCPAVLDPTAVNWLTSPDRKGSDLEVSPFSPLFSQEGQHVGQLLGQGEQLTCLCLEQERVDGGLPDNSGLQVGVGREEDDLGLGSDLFELRHRFDPRQLPCQTVIQHDDLRLCRPGNFDGFLG